ncbi:MAG: zinc ribbon domain-containing protein [Planctomycetota bacterium]|nr:MAG: zinc ribbon domain-containing protein [Planctomycetota bacterium]
MNARWFLVLVLFVAGCQHREMLKETDQGRLLEKEARTLQRSGAYAEAARNYALAAERYERALDIATERQNEVFSSFLSTKLSIVTRGEADCVRPDRDGEGSWERAYELYGRAAEHAEAVSMLKLKGLARSGQAECRRPDLNPQGDWGEAARLYEEAAALAEDYKGAKERGEALRWEAICLSKGQTEDLSREARRMLERARDLGDEEAARILAQAKGHYCRACGEPLEAEQRFCGRCGQDQTKPVRPPPEASSSGGKLRRLRSPSGEGGGLGGGARGR